MRKISTFLFLLLTFTTVTRAQSDAGILGMDEFRSIKKRKNIDIPDISGFHTLKCDFHMHTVFSDGLVWPSIRVEEVWKEGLDVMAITDHVEYQPHKEDVLINHNRAFELAEDLAKKSNIILIKGTEITRNTPPGHFNALFIGDASEYIENREGELDKQAILKASEQKAFIFWNHPGWKEKSIEGSYEWIDFVNELHSEKSLHGIEVFNGFSFHKKALDWCVDKGLTVMGTSDIHNLIAHDYKQDDNVHRSMTLVFAKERTEASVREALEAGRTVAWSSNYIAGKEEHVEALFNACVEMGSSYYTKVSESKNGEKQETNYYELKNNSDLNFHLKLKSGKGTEEIILYPQSTQIITANAGQPSLTYEVVSTYIRSDKHLSVLFNLK